MADNHDTAVKTFFDNTDWSPGTSWRTLANDLIDFLISEGACFSSGEVARWLRIHMPNERFSVPTLGEHVRDLFYAGGMGMYPDDGYGSPVYPSQVPRTTQGLGRTPAGVQVFVYCPDQNDGFNHPFEVDIPFPGGQPTSYPTVPTPGGQAMQHPPAQQVHMPTQPAKPKQPVKITGSAAPTKYATIQAKVHDDRRLCIPRSAFELYVHFTGQPMKGGDPVFVSMSKDKVLVSLQATNALTSVATTTYDLSTTRGRVLIPHPANPFTPGDVYDVTVASDGLTVDLTQTV
jgi:hypothetical protein